MWLLVTVYLLNGADTPFVQHRTYEDKATCQTVAEKYVKQAVVGQSRAFCMRIKK